MVISFLAQNKGPLVQFTPEYITLYRETQIAIISIVSIFLFFCILNSRSYLTGLSSIFFFIYFYNVPLKSQIELALVEPILMCLYLLFITTLSRLWIAVQISLYYWE